MDRTTIVILVILVIFGIGSWIANHSNGLTRVRRHIELRGGKVISIQPPGALGSALFDDEASRTFVVRYLDRDGNEHRARALVSGWTRVFVGDDRIVHHANSPMEKSVEALDDENARLRAELERLKRKERNRDSDAIQE